MKSPSCTVPHAATCLIAVEMNVLPSAQEKSWRSDRNAWYKILIHLGGVELKFGPGGSYSVAAPGSTIGVGVSGDGPAPVGWYRGSSGPKLGSSAYRKVFNRGAWYVVTLEAGTTFVLTRDAHTIIEICWDSNGWFRARVDGEDWVVWSRGTKSHQQLHDRTLRSFIARGDWASQAIPLHPGLRTTIGSTEYTSRIEVTADELRITNHDGNVIHVPCSDPSGANFKDHNLSSLPDDS
jgi:hypothetical protein